MEEILKKYFLHVSLITLFIFTSCGEDGITKSPAVDVIAVTPLQSVITIGETIQFTAEALDIDLNPIVGVDFEWKSSNTDAVSIDETGLATGKAMDRDVIITVTADAIESNDAMIHVAGDPAVIEIPVTAEAVLEGKTIQVFGSIKDELGTEIPDAEIENWSVGNSSLISVSEDGIVTGLAHGLTTISASFGSISSDSIKIYVWAESFREDFSSVDTTTIDDGYFKGNNGIIWQMNHSLETDTSSAGPHTGKPAIVEDNGNPVLQLTEPSTAYFTNRQLLIMTYGSTTYDDFYMWPEGDDMLTLPNFRVQMRVKGIDDPVAGTSAESIVNFTQYFGGAASPYYLVYAPGRNRVSAWFGASLAPGASIPAWGSIPEIDYDQWFSFVIEVFDGTMRTEIFSGVEPTGEWDYSYTIPDWTGEEENIPGLWFGAFLMDEYYADDIIYCTP